MKKRAIIVGIIVLVIIVVIFLGINSINIIKDTQTSHYNGYENNEEQEQTNVKEVDDSTPTELSIPFKIEDLNLLQGEVNPLGIVRFSKDQGDVGHPGIDFPLKENSEIYAVADGEIVLVGSAGDPWGGMKVFQLLKETNEGEGWAFIYEHIKLADGIEISKELKKGDLIGYKVAPEGFTAHLQLSRVFNNFQYTTDASCWPDFLLEEEKEKLDSWWVEYSSSEHLINSWKTTMEEGKYPFRGLLDEIKYPEGPMFCYDLGTDVR